MMTGIRQLAFGNIILSLFDQVPKRLNGKTEDGWDEKPAKAEKY